MSTVTIQITLDVDDTALGSMPVARRDLSLVGALENLASIMAVQAEDGLWSLGSPEAEDDNGPSVFVAEIFNFETKVEIR